MLKTSFSEHNKIWGGTKRLGVTAPECPPCLRTWAEPSPKSSIGGLHVFAGGLDILKMYI